MINEFISSMFTHRHDILRVRGRLHAEKVKMTNVWDKMETGTQSGMCHSKSCQQQNTL